ncbi:hypothetical protein SAMN05444166_3210 [Singulisphaera sp. GP187]|nr:hypothetical protein SAMN05444166_3210 [Singulisphaera sp. GP187]
MPLASGERKNGQEGTSSATDRRVGSRDLPSRLASARAQASGRRPGSAESSGSAEQEFREAIEDYQQKSGRMFPTWSEVLEVLQGLGYRKLNEEQVPLRSS